MADPEKIWKSVQAALKVSISGATFNMLIKPTELLVIDAAGDRLICELGCPSNYVKQQVEQKYYAQIAEELKRVTEKHCELKLVVHDKPVEETIDLPLFTNTTNDSWKRARLKAESTFDNYAVSGSNQMAYAAATAVAKKPGEAYNPLFIYGGVGVGKTHLMQAIGHALLTRGDGPVLFCSGEEFTNDLVEGIKNKTTDKVRAKYRKVKLLLIDDVQFIAGKASVQEDFFHTFNSLQREGGQVVMTSDKPPSEIAKLEERLKSRFGAGMIVDVGPADFELRTAILLIKARQRQIELPMTEAQTIASHIEGVRELEGFLVRLINENSISVKSLAENIDKLLKISKTETSRKILTPAEVINFVGGYYGVGVQQIKSERRTKTLVGPRQILMHLLRNDLRLPTEEVGRLLGGRDHSTVMYGDEKIKLNLKSDVLLQQQLQEIKHKLLITS